MPTTRSTPSLSLPRAARSGAALVLMLLVGCAPPGASEPTGDVGGDGDAQITPSGWTQEEVGDVPDVPHVLFEVDPVPWPAYHDLGTLSGGLDVFTGSVDPAGGNAWDGDTDAFRFITPFEGTVELSLSWTGTGNLDVVSYCYYFDAINPPNYYAGVMGEMQGTAIPEYGESVVEIPANHECWVGVMGYSGEVDYTLSAFIF